MRKSLILLIAIAAALISASGASAASGAVTVTVPAIQPTTDTGVLITAGTAAVVTASGHWDVCGGACPSGPDGATNGDIGFCTGTFGHPAGELIGSLDGGSTFFDVGAGPTVVSAPGELLLAPNDCAFSGDNTGSLTATIALTPTSKDACKKGGWSTLQEADGTAFKNQGDCVSYVNTGK
jgi:hypothetical protein